MADELRVVITAKDGASRVFKEVGTAAKGVGTDAEKAGEKGERGFKRMGDAAQKTKIDTQALGAALTALGAGLAYSSAMAMQQERQLIALNRAFGDNADEVIRFAEELDNLTIFSDDDIRAGQRFFATLQNNYDLSIDQIKELMVVTSELAAASGTSFEDASSRVTAAIRGEGEAAEYLGLTMNQQSIDRENLTLAMTNQEAAQFRLNALLGQSAPYIGTNNDLMQTSIGMMAEWKDRAQDLGASIGDIIGGAGTMALSFGSLGLGITGLTQSFGAFGTALTRVRASMATGLLASAFTPMGLAITGLTVGVGLLTGAFLQNQKQAAEAKAVIATLKDAYLDLAVAADNAGKSGDVAAEARLNQLRFQAESVRAEADLMYKTLRDSDEFKFNGVDYDRDAWFDLQDSYEITSQEAATLADAQAKLGAALQDSSIDGKALAADMDDLYWRFMRQEITADQYILLMADMADNTSRYAIATDEATTAQDRLNAALADGVVSFSDLGLMANVAVSSIENFGREYRNTRKEVDEATVSLNVHENALAGVTGGLNAMATARLQAFAGIGAGFAEIAATEMEEYAAWLDVVADNLNRLLAVAGYDDPLSRWNLSGHASDASLLAMNLQNASESLDSTFRVIVGNTDAIASQVAGIQTWADELINVEGQYGKIDDLLRDGLITQEQYNDAQLAYNGIAADNLRIQNDVLAIQAMQAPLIADQTQATAEYMEQLRQLPAEQQLVALGWMDAATAGRAMELQTLAIAAANGELGANGTQAFDAMITGAANADPVLKALLVDMELISVGADGTITVNYGSLEGARSEIAILTDSINVLIETLGGVPPNVTTTVDLVDNASGPLAGIRQTIANLDGTRAITYVETIFSSQGVRGQMNGGVVEAYADGGVVIRAGEIGPEIIHYANGGTAVMPYDGLYSVPVGSYISPAHASQSRLGGSAVVTFTGNFYGSNRQELEAWADGYLVPAMVDAINDERRGQVRI